MDVKVGDTICYIQKYMSQGGKEWSFRLLTTPITSIRIGKTATKAYSKLFNPLDVEELKINTKCFVPGIILTQEPFLDVKNLREIAERWIENKGWEHQPDWFDEVKADGTNQEAAGRL